VYQYLFIPKMKFFCLFFFYQIFQIIYTFNANKKYNNIPLKKLINHLIILSNLIDHQILK